MDKELLIESWKKKAVSRSAEIKYLKKRMKEKVTSRDKWKEKYILQKDEALRFKNELETIKKKIEEVLG